MSQWQQIFFLKIFDWIKVPNICMTFVLQNWIFIIFEGLLFFHFTNFCNFPWTSQLYRKKLTDFQCRSWKFHKCFYNTVHAQSINHILEDFVSTLCNKIIFVSLSREKIVGIITYFFLTQKKLSLLLGEKKKQL